MTRFTTPLGRDTEFGFLSRNTEADQILNPLLISNTDEQTMLHAIRSELARCETFVFSVAFITSRAIALLKEALLEFDGAGTIITSRYLDFNDPDAFRELLLLDNVEVYIHEDIDRGFHAKGYIFQRQEGVTAIVGSSNLTDNALLVNQEWNLRFSAFPDGDIAYQLDAAVQRQKSRALPLSKRWIDEYEQTRQVRPVLIPGGDSSESLLRAGRIRPNHMQTKALESLREVRESGESRAVIISATGTGKTILAALAVRQAAPQRMLFVVHREQILDKAITEFQQVLDEPDSSFGKLVGAKRETDRKYVFSTVQSLSRESTLSQLDPEGFDYIIIDEVHRSGADSYRRVIDHFAPAFLLGLTATPERTDGFNVFELFDYNVPYEIRLHEALEERMLVPFHYYGVTDFVDAEDRTIEDTAQLQNLVAGERVSHVLEMLRRYGHPTSVKGLMFCSRKDEAHQLSELFNTSEVNGRQLHTRALTGDDTAETRESVVQQLESGELDYILTVDIFNEGIDIPPVNQVVMLRRTQSSIIFTQQLGRGLRKAEGKDHLRVIDFIGNYTNNYLIPIALFGDSSRSKDRLRKKMRDNATTNTLARVSSVNFDPIAQKRILDSLSEAQLVGKRLFKGDIVQMGNRLGKIPRLFDFARFDTVDPVLLASQYDKASKPRSYWQLLKDLKLVEHGPNPLQAAILAFLSAEVLPGKRPHELILLEHLLQNSQVSRGEFARLLQARRTWADAATISSTERVLDLSFYTQAQQEKFGGSPLVVSDAFGYRLSEDFRNTYESPARAEHGPAEHFRRHVDDIIETGLFLSREHGFWNQSLNEGAMYSRRDVCRLLNWDSNQESTVYGYKTDWDTRTCPIFITYHKADDISDSMKYDDSFLSPEIIHWFSKHGRKIDSDELRPIMNHEVDLHVFIKKDDAEGNDFYYLGTAEASSEQQQTMPGKDGKQLKVVAMNLELDSPVEQGLYDYLTKETALKSD